MKSEDQTTSSPEKDENVDIVCLSWGDVMIQDNMLKIDKYGQDDYLVFNIEETELLFKMLRNWRIQNMFGDSNGR